MQQGLGSPDASIFVAVGGWVVAILIALLTAVIQLRRGGAEETAVVLGKWKELVEAHEKQIKGLNEEISALRHRVHELEELVEEQREIIKKLEKALEGERRQGAQRERSFKEQLARLSKSSNEGIRK